MSQENGNSIKVKDAAKHSHKKIENIKELIELLNDGEPHDCFILLNCNLRSSKSMFLNEDGTFSVINEIDDSEDEYSLEELSNPEKTNIAKAISLGAFYSY